MAKTPKTPKTPKDPKETATVPVNPSPVTTSHPDKVAVRLPSDV